MTDGGGESSGAAQEPEVTAGVSIPATGGGATAPAGWHPDTQRPGFDRYWDGNVWTEQWRPTSGHTPGLTGGVERKTAEERKAILAQQMQGLVAQGRRVESQSDFQAVLVYGKPINHTLQLILTLVTCLLWGLVWLVLALTGGERREMVVVDEFGLVQVQRLGKS